jgi:hypothetical protein
MKRFIILILTTLLNLIVLQAQEQPPFILTTYGGLFFPSNIHFKDTYKSTNDLIWGFGACLPMKGTIFLAGDLAFFHSEAFIDTANDSSTTLQEKFFHIGLLSKLPITQSLLFRLTAGVNYVTVTQKISSSRSSEHDIEGDHSAGYFAGFGIEQLFVEDHFSLFSDMIYDYRRLHQRELEGDFGGVRFVIGVHLYLQ